jgi:hypothetical protein
VRRAHFGDQLLTEGKWLGVRIVYPERSDAGINLVEHGVAQRDPGRRHRVGRIEIDIDDVLVFLWRILCKSK